MFNIVKARNFLSFREGVEVSFELGKGQKSETEVSNVLGVFGANSSGKTNLLKIFSTLKNICCNSANENPDEINLVTPFYDISEEVSFFAEFNIEDARFRYEIDLTPKKIISEVISRKMKGGHWNKVIERSGTVLVKVHKDFGELETLGSIRDSASIISIAYFLGKECILPLYNQFKLITISIEDRGFNHILNYQKVSKFYNDSPRMFSFVKDIIVKADLGISDIKIKSAEAENGDKFYFPYFIHPIDSTQRILLYNEESGGTQTLYSTLFQYALVLNSGGILVIDELEINLHPLLYPLLLDIFLDSQKNKNNAQIIFTTHREDMFDTLGKYRSIITDKKDNESCAYRLDNLPENVIRNDRPITPLYLKGLLGGIPLLSELKDSKVPDFEKELAE